MSSKKQLDSLTGLRGISAYMVVITHAVSHFRRPTVEDDQWGHINEPGNGFDIMYSFITSGLMSVYFFFALSGFLLTYRAYCEIIPTHKSKQVSKENPATHDTTVPHPDLVMPTGWNIFYYVIRRFFRIYPAFLVVLPFASHGKPYPVVWTSTFWKRLLMIDMDNSHFWTIRVEMAYYMIIPILQLISAYAMKFENYLASIGKRVPRHSIHLWTILAITGIAIWIHTTSFIYIPYADEKPAVYQNFPVFWYGSLAGTVYFYMKRHGYTMGKPKGKKQTILFYAAEVVTYAMIVLIAISNKATSLGYFGKLVRLATCSFASIIPFVAILILVLALTQDETSLGKAFSSSFLLWVGKTSYSIYLINYVPIEFVFEALGLRGIEALMLIFVIEAWFGWALHFFVEDRGVNLGNKLIKKIKTKWELPRKKAKITVNVETPSLIPMKKQNSAEETDTPAITKKDSVDSTGSNQAKQQQQAAAA